MDELRNEIFDLLYRGEGSKSISEIAGQVNQDGDTVREAIDHDWFSITEDQVTIAYGNP